MVKKIFTVLFRIFIALFLIFGGVQHFMNMEFYLPFVPAFLPFKPFVIYASGVLEIIIGIGLLIPKTKQFSAWAYLLLMLSFLPVHVADLFTETPAMGTHSAAIIRLFVQFLLIALGIYFVRFATSTTPANNEN
ncbi:MAG: hypothetical protein COB98_06720 [Flavobacteriaceae bacterium]|nr:MAG: hypothetical protein COB98_06720 [Flavobacteriaceae bacterium]